MMIEGEALHAVPYGGVSEAELAMLRNTAAGERSRKPPS